MATVVSLRYHEYLSSPQWREKRQARLRIDNYRCSRCESQERLEVHHLTYDRLGREHLVDLATLCRACHAREHGRDSDLPTIVSGQDVRRRVYRREPARLGMDVWQGIVAQAGIARYHLDLLFERLLIDEVDDPRVAEIKRTLDAFMRDQAAAWGREWSRAA